MKVVKVLLFISGITVILIVVSIKSFPEWLAIPGGLLILSSLAFNWVLDAGSKIKSWVELLEKKGVPSREDELKQNLTLKRRIEKDFSDWLNYFPENRKRNSKMLLRAFDGKQYPDSNEPDKFGEYSWFAAEIKGVYHSGLEFIYGIEELAIINGKKWDIRKNVKGEFLTTVKAYRVGQINFSDIVDYDLEGDEFYQYPHFFCKFKYKGLPFEEVYYQSMDERTPHYFEFKDKSRKSQNTT
jgi:hypothetical protein